MDIKRDPFITLITWEIPWVLGALCQMQGKEQIYIYYKSQYQHVS